MPSFSEIMADETTAHTFTLLRVAAGQRVEALRHIESLFDELTTHAAKFGGVANANGPKFRQLEQEAGLIIRGAYKVIGEGQVKDLEKIAGAEDAWALKTLNKGIGVDIYTKRLEPKTLQAIAAGKIIEGHPASAWWAGQGEDLRRRFSGEVSKGILLGETTPQIVKRITGGSLPSEPGLKRKAQRDATALVRTSVQAVANTARVESFKDKKTVKGIEWLSTLDSRTTVICMALDGKQWRFPDFEPIGHAKKYPGSIAHVQCRSTQTAVLYSWSELSGKKVPELDNRTLQEAITERLEAEGWKPEKINAALANARASIDGPVRKTETFQSWADTKGPDFIASVIGPGRQELYNTGKITFSDLTNQDNRPLTIKQLEEAVAGGKIPPETLGKGFIAYEATNRSAVKVQEIAEQARKDAEEAQTRAERQSRALLGELMTTEAQQHGGPYADARAAVDAAQEDNAEKLRGLWERVTDQAAPAWLDAWANGQASPHTPDARPNRLRIEAWARHAKGKPKTAATWRELAAGWKADKASEGMRRAMDTAAAAMEAAQKKLEAIQTAAGKNPSKLEAALLDAMAALEDARSKIIDAQEIAD